MNAAQEIGRPAITREECEFAALYLGGIAEACRELGEQGQAMHVGELAEDFRVLLELSASEVTAEAISPRGRAVIRAHSEPALARRLGVSVLAVLKGGTLMREIGCHANQRGQRVLPPPPECG